MEDGSSSGTSRETIMRPEPKNESVAPVEERESLIDRLGVAFFDLSYNLMISPIGAIVVPLFAGKARPAA